MLSGVQRRLDLPAVLAGGGDDGHGVNVRILDHFPEISVDLLHAQLFPGIFQLRRNNRARGSQFRVGNFAGDIGGMNLAQPSQTCDADPQFLHNVCPFLKKN